MKNGSKVGRRNNATSPFRTVYPEKGGRVVTSAQFSPKKCVKTATWSHSVNSEHFLIAVANHVQIQPSTRCDLTRDTPSRCKRQPRQHFFVELATITDVTVLQMGHCADHQRTQAQTTDGVRDNVKRFDTIFTEIRRTRGSRRRALASNAFQHHPCLPTKIQ